ncbi:DUF1269 domain-containing protein [Novosphingobium sp.]|uniref:general stress protein n=1 Tax=Novosphingobium sp. TaxID=1874826 RepID=UPI00333ED9C5
MSDSDTMPAAAIGTFADHDAAEAAVRELGLAGFDISHLSVVGKGYHTDEHVTGFYNQGDRVRFWGARGAFWGGLWGLFFGGLFLTVPVVGPVVVLGHIGLVVVGALETALAVGGVSALSAGLYGMGIPQNSVLMYETAISADSFLVMAHDTPDRIAMARQILATAGASRVDVYDGLHPATANTAVMA